MKRKIALISAILQIGMFCSCGQQGDVSQPQDISDTVSVSLTSAPETEAVTETEKTKDTIAESVVSESADDQALSETDKIKKEYGETLALLGYDENENGLYIGDINGDSLPEMVIAYDPDGGNTVVYSTDYGVEKLGLGVHPSKGASYFIDSTHQIVSIIEQSSTLGTYGYLYVEVYDWNGSDYVLSSSVLRYEGYKDIDTGECEYGRIEVNGQNSDEETASAELEKINKILMDSYGYTAFVPDANGVMIGYEGIISDENRHDICLWNGECKLDDVTAQWYEKANNFVKKCSEEISNKYGELKGYSLKLYDEKGDGDYRAAALLKYSGTDEYGTYTGEIVYINKNGITELLSATGDVSLTGYDINFYTFEDYSIVIGYTEAGSAGNFSSVWLLKGDNAEEMEFPIKVGGLKRYKGNQFTCFHSAYDSSYDWYSNDEYGFMGHTWKTYFLYWNGTKFVEYGGIDITEEQFCMAEGGKELLDSIKADGEVIDSIIYRENGIININYRKYSDEDNKSFTANNATVQLVDGKLFKPTYTPFDMFTQDEIAIYDSGIYVESIFEGGATFPDKWPLE